MRSLRGRLNRGLVAILVIVFASQWLLGSYATRLVVEHEMLTRLEHDGDSLLSSFEVGQDGAIRFDTHRLGLIYEQTYSGHYLDIHADGQVFHSRSLADEHMAVEPLAPGQRRQYHCVGPEGQPLLVLARGLALQGQNITLTVAEELTAIDHEIASLSLGYLVLSTSLLLVAIIWQRLDVRRALRPLSELRRDLLAIARGESSRIASDAPAEIRPLVDEINRLLVLTARRLQQSRTAVGNLAHALKTPLAILFRIAADSRLEATPDLARHLLEQSTTIHRRIERELKRARLAGAGSSGALFNPGEELPVLVQVLENVYLEKNLAVEVVAPCQLFPYDREDLLELIGNLADNACKWAEGKVHIHVACQDGFTVNVEDDGPGCTPDKIAQLSQRGLRLDESKPGHGLGLAIARDIAEFYGGDLEFGRSESLGGLSVRVFLPMPPAIA
ncbi:sensor histidine kinase [Methylococcus sp. EFPC2]|uniref:sensor histidine kinase n=1 Tax=Methylococcus sp. EFPC2 TaxID=2812648 RepID=UPI00196841A6|nr:sensor histidine kinase [Methylococcus sp. EFPC2]QSA97359.1 sensor histidine kinase [Methylococcus sp. EFPC2]